MNLRKLKNQAGFTLVELIVVIAIMAILAGVAVPVYSGYIEKAEKAGDLQLLDAVNSAFGAACIENDTDAHSVTSKVGQPQIKDYDSVAVEPFTDEFQFYFSGNEGGFETFDKQNPLVYSNGAFRDLASAASDPNSGINVFDYAGGKVYLTDQQVAALGGSTFIEQIGVESLLNQVDDVTGFAQEMAGTLAVVLDSDGFVMSAANALGIKPDLDSNEFWAEYNKKTGDIVAKMVANGMTPEEAQKELQANAAVLYAAQGTVGMSKDEINAFFKDATVTSLAGNLGKEETAGSALAQSALVYGMYTAYNATLPADDPNKISGTVTPDVVIDNIENADFKKWVASEQGQKDLDGYLAAMNAINSSTSSTPAVEELLINGFSDPNLKDVISNALGSSK